MGVSGDSQLAPRSDLLCMVLQSHWSLPHSGNVGPKNLFTRAFLTERYMQIRHETNDQYVFVG